MRLNARAIFWGLMIIWVLLTVLNWNAQKSADIIGFFLIITFFTALCTESVAFLYRVGAIDHRARLNAMAFIFSVLLSVCISELILRVSVDDLKAHNEKNGHPYTSVFNIMLTPCDSCGGKKMYVNHSNAKVIISNNEFYYVHQYNGFGLRDQQFDRQKKKNEFRILGIGDSFTEGVGTSADSTWLKQLEHKLNLGQDTVIFTSMNAGAHGSDLFFEYDLLSNYLLPYQPDLVILDLNATDIADVTRGGGNERFNNNGDFEPHKGPWWEFAFGSSYIVRLFVLKLLKYDWQFRSHHRQDEENEIVLKKISDKINEYQALGRKAHFKFLLVLQPLFQDFYRGDQFSRLQLDSSVQKIDLYPYFKSKIITQGCPIDRYYWPIDGHFKGSGYGEMAERIRIEYFEKQSGAGN